MAYMHLDIDSFYVQAECVRDPTLRDKPVAVTQFNSGGFVAVNAAAKAKGISKGDGIGHAGFVAIERYTTRPDATMEGVLRKCPDLVVLPMDTTWYRSVSMRILRELERCVSDVSGAVVCKLSIDDFMVYLPPSSLCSPPQAATRASSPSNNKLQSSQDTVVDTAVTADSTWIVGVDVAVRIDDISDTTLRVAASYAAQFRKRLKQNLSGMTCSCGVAHNKLIARTISDYHKPDGQTALPSLVPSPARLSAVNWVLANTLLRDVWGFKAQLGELVERNATKYLRDCERTSSHADATTPERNDASNAMSEVTAKAETVEPITLITLQRIPHTLLTAWCGDKLGKWLADARYGVDAAAIQPFTPPATVIAERSFPPTTDKTTIAQWVSTLSTQLHARVVDDYKEFDRCPTKCAIAWRIGYETRQLTSKSCVLPNSYRRSVLATPDTAAPSGDKDGTTHITADGGSILRDAMLSLLSAHCSVYKSNNTHTTAHTQQRKQLVPSPGITRSNNTHTIEHTQQKKQFVASPGITRLLLTVSHFVSVNPHQSIAKLCTSNALEKHNTSAAIVDCDIADDEVVFIDNDDEVRVSGVKRGRPNTIISPERSKPRQLTLREMMMGSPKR